MKIQIFDVTHVINQIKRASPPKDKQTHKLLNNLAILLEKNTTKKQSPLEKTHIATVEKLNEAFLDLCFLRKEILKKFSQEYFDTLSNAIIQLRKNQKVLESAKIQKEEMIEWDLKTIDESNEIMPEIFSKLKKAKSVIEDAMDKNKPSSKNPNGVLESFFTDI